MKKSFTLGEVLLVIGILGAVAVLTLPNLKNNTSEETNVSLLKTAYSQLETAISSVVADYGSIQSAKNASSDCGSENETTCFNNLVANKLDLQLNCQTSNLSRCYFTEKPKNVNGNNARSNDCEYAFILSNGVSICSLSSASKYEIDVNGGKNGSNVVGIDVFETYIDSNDDLSYDDPTDFNTTNTARAGGGDFTVNRDETAWVMNFGNMDYLKCGNNLKWNQKVNCDNQ